MRKKKGVSLIVLVITILVMIILTGVAVVFLSENNPIEKAKIAAVKQDVGILQTQVSRIVAQKLARDPKYKMNGTLQENAEGLNPELVEKYNDVLYIENGSVCLDAIVAMEDSFLNKKYKIEAKALSDGELSFVPMKTQNNEIKNGEFNFPTEKVEKPWSASNYGTDKITIETEVDKNGEKNKYASIRATSKVASRVVLNQTTEDADSNTDVYYFTCKYRKHHVDNLIVEYGPIKLYRGGGGYVGVLLGLKEYNEAPENKWLVANSIRIIEEKHISKKILFEVSGGVAATSPDEFAIDVDDVIALNLNRLFPKDKIPKVGEWKKEKELEEKLNKFFAEKYYKK